METDELNDSLVKLIQAAQQFFYHAARAYAQDLPTDAAAFSALHRAGEAVPGVMLAPFEPQLTVQLGYSYRGTWQPFFSWQPPAPQPQNVN